MSEKENVVTLSENAKEETRNTTTEPVKIDESNYLSIIDYSAMSEPEIAQAALNRIEEQSNIACGPVPGIFIYKSLIKEVNINPELAKKILIKCKTLSKCFDYIISILREKARQMMDASGDISGTGKRSNSACVGVNDQELIELVIEYYMLDDKALDAKKAAEKAKTEEAKKKAEEARKKATKEKAKADDQKSAEKSKAKTKKPEKKKANANQGSLFAMLGVDD